MALEVNFFNIRSTLEDIEDEQKKEKLVKECLTEHFLAPCPPFSIINPSQIKVNRDGKKLLGRNYGWGFADCFNPDNSDFSRLHKLVLRHVRSELIATTQQKYKNFDNDLAAKEAGELSDTFPAAKRDALNMLRLARALEACTRAKASTTVLPSQRALDDEAIIDAGGSWLF